MKAKKITITFALTTCLTAVAGTKAAQAASLTVIADGISNARGAAFGPDGNLYVGEPGIGGNGNCQPSPSTLFQPICAGNTGSVVKITPDGKQERIFNNFQSLAEQPSGNQGAGPQELKFDSQGNAYLLTAFAGYPGNRDLELSTLGTQYPLPEAQLLTFPPSPPDQVLNTPNLGKLFKADLKTEQLTEIFDFGKYEIINNPDQADVVSNPYELNIGGNTAYVVDGGGNTAYKIKLDGSDVAAIPLPKKLINNPDFPPLPPGAEIPPGLVEIPADALPEGQPAVEPGQIPAKILVQSVPTGAAIGLDGALYVGEYLGFPYPEGEARIFRIGEDNQPQVFADGFTHITDLTFDKNGNLLVLQFSDQAQWKGDLQNLPGSLIQLAPDGTRTTLVAAGEGLASADGITIGPDNQIYVTTRGVGLNLGQIVRVERTRIPEPSSMLGLLVVSAIGGSAMLKRKHRVSC
ncbi:hypothetical protein DSM106972_085140 [Dulcicalothrix desertica PCC 7102]|uniref:PEP-CTERM protein-sorting domain-containing protein n=1 Tax=Dulcicalothrix desertica PCC 7102 TaxID=232991 RepID=A0A433UU86_9CYAN|nr:ScyD/ScyE family protein [Dulcicalothrix desertica]RUS97411.1 hypothetical protein DSM106972_085140 [Dulcicalothrix desertica PCC 7102]TWH55589.1 putative secreted protein with PEP-CTERM sorting signal [Dulcicalothrix desertica PCC 7102]